jgi:hypothetical protein
MGTPPLPRRPRTLGRRRALGALWLAGSGLAACARGTGPGNGATAFPTAGASGPPAARPIEPGALVANPAKNEWPQPFWKASAEVQEAYRYALAHPDVLQYVPCFCGCGAQGHQSNKDCYVRRALPDGAFVLEPMSFG